MSIETATAPFEAWILAPGQAAAIAPMRRSVLPAAAPPPRLWVDIDPPHEPTEDASIVAEIAPWPIAFSEGELARACAGAAWAAAERERGERAAMLAKAEAVALERLARELTLADAGFQRCLEATAAALSQAFAAAGKAAGVLRQGQAERLEAMLRATFAETLRAPELRVTVAPSLLDTAQRVMPEAVATAGFGGSLAVAADATPGAPSVRIDWGDGWAEADLGRIESLLIDHLAGGGPAIVRADAVQP